MVRTNMQCTAATARQDTFACSGYLFSLIALNEELADSHISAATISMNLRGLQK